MSTLRYFYQVNINGEPIQGSNVAIHKKPTQFGKGQRWVEFIPVAKQSPCCTDGSFKVTSIGKPWRYYVRLRESTNLPIAGSLMKHHNKPKGNSWPWQEVIGRHQCATFAQFELTYTKTAEPATINIFSGLGFGADSGYAMVETGAMDTDRGSYHLVVTGAGGVTITDTGGGTDSITLHYTVNGCTTAFKLTIVG